MAGVNTPYLTIDLDKIEHNARTIVDLCDQHGIAVTGVTKGVCGYPDVARAMLRGGVTSIADSRLENIRRLGNAGIDTDFMLLRVPPLSAVDAVVESIDVSLNSELATLKDLSAAAIRAGKIHNVMLMVDLGDLREGIWPDDVMTFVSQAINFDGIRIKGIGANLACFGGVVPSEENMNQLAELASVIEHRFSMTLEWVSGVNSSGLEMIASGKMPQRINHARIGEAILLGRETIHRKPWPGTVQDAFVLHAEIVELKQKPSLPVGERSEDAFGELVEFEDRGKILRALINVGREDIDIHGITPLDSRIDILGGSSGYLVLDVFAMEGNVAVGDELSFTLNYSALLTAMTSEYVTKHILTGVANSVEQ
ncbi:MAG: alanine/ornithine racemase family PLP-dependent enzyme [Nitrosomonas sp.]|nr:alanine/ornithine racemase family PLP-dependent enzyme [Nitrosomonas sp.]